MTETQIVSVTGQALFCGDGSVRTVLVEAVRSGADLAGADLARANLARADLAEANLVRANLAEADLAEADLAGANLAGADLIDGGQDRRGYRFWAWRRADGQTILRAGCREWESLEGALAHYRGNYRSDGDVEECVARLQFLVDEAQRRGWSASDAAD